MAIYSLSRIGFLQRNVKQSMRQSMYNIVVGDKEWVSVYCRAELDGK